MTTAAIINAVLSVLAVFGLAFAALGWRHSLRRPAFSAEWYFAMAKVLLAVGLAIRLLMWDALWGVIYHLTDYDTVFYDLGYTNVNIGSTCIVLVGVYCSLKARQKLLLDDRGIDWHWTIAWAYPRARTIVALTSRNGRRKI